MTEQDIHGPGDTGSENEADRDVEATADEATEGSLLAGLADQPLVQEDLAEKYHADPDDSDDAADPELTNDFDEAGTGAVDAVMADESEPAMSAEPEQAPEPEFEPDDSDEEDEDPDDEDPEDEEERRRRDEEFAKEHDPKDHDVEAGSEFRQRGDWTADESGAEALESRLEDVRDGGYGVGSAAPFDDGLMPFGHSIKAWHDTMTFVRPGEAGYDGVNPDVWFLDEGFAERVGFRAAH